jgi:hypothetical protein
MRTRAKGFLIGIVVGVATTVLSAEEEHKRPVEGIMDNSFLIEEAYNQEAGVVQHIVNGVYGVDKVFGPEKHSLAFSYTDEWPVFSQKHQFSYTVPYGFERDDSGSANGLGDTFLNYRYQLYLNEKTLAACAPRFSLVLPTGEDEKGFGNGALGYQWNLPLSTAVGDRWFIHANAGLTYLPGVGSARVDLLDYNVGASAIYCVNDRFDLMLEWVGYSNDSVEAGERAEREFSSVISPGMRYAFNLRNGSQFVVGLSVPIGVTDAAPDVGAFIYLSFEHKLKND